MARINHKDHLHPSDSNWRKKCKDHIEKTGEPIAQDGYHVLSPADFKRLNEGLNKRPKSEEATEVPVEPKFFDVDEMAELIWALNANSETLDHLGLEAMYSEGKWTLKVI